MSASPEITLEPQAPDLRSLERTARACLRQANINPFGDGVAVGPNDPQCRTYDVPELLAEQRQDLVRIIDQFRCYPPRPSQIFPVLGQAGAGKTHLLAALKRILDIGDSPEG